MITSTSNPQVKNLQQLAKKAKVRNEQDVFLVEGMKMFREAPRERIRKVYLSKSLYEEKGQAFCEGLDVEILEDHVFAAASDTRTPQGILCIMKQYHYQLSDLTKKECPHLLILENLQDPGNLGTVMRTAEAAGVNGVIMSRDTVDIYNPKVVRSTMGAIFRLPFAYADSLFDVAEQCKQMGVTLYAAHLRGENSYDREDYRKASAFLIGNEANGLSDELSNQADRLIRIPMAGKAESLNAAVAAAVLSYEAARQRGW